MTEKCESTAAKKIKELQRRLDNSRQRERELSGRESYYRAFFENSLDGIVVVDPATSHFIDFNNQACRDLGYSREEFSRLRVTDIEARETEEEIRQHIGKARQQGYADFETLQRTRQGEIRHVHVRVKAMELAGHNVFHCVFRDISHRKKGEEALRQSEQRFFNAFEYAPIGMAMMSIEGNILKVNRATCNLFGYSRDELQRRNYKDFLHSDPAPSSSFEQMLTGKTSSYQIERSYFHKEGHVVWALLSISLIRDRHRAPAYFLAQLVDITERKQAEMAKERQNKVMAGINAIFGAVVTSADDREFGTTCLNIAEDVTGSTISFLGMLGKDQRLHDIAVSNPTWESCAVYNRPKSGVITRNFHFQGIYTDVIINGKMLMINEPATILNSARLPPGHPPLNSLLGVPVKSDAGTIGMIVVGNSKDGYDSEDQETMEVLARVISEALSRRRAEEALRQSDIRYRNLFRYSPDAIYINQQECVTLVNDACLELFGARTPEELLGKTPYDLFHADCHQEIREHIQQLRDEGRSTSVLEGKIIRLDGGIVEVEVTAAHFPLGESRANHVILRDISNRKRAAENLERSNRDLEQFAYAVSHDLQEPIRSIIGFLQLLQQRYENQMDEKGRSYIERTVAAGRRMQEQILGLLSLSRLTTDRGTFTPTDLNLLISTVLESLEKALEEKSAEVSCESLPTLTIDARQIQRLFQNLIMNGIKYNRSPFPTIQIGCRRFDDTYEFFVRDNGIGVPARFHDRIFEIFQRLHTTEEYEGTGLGLALCRKIVDRHGGTIRIESEPGQGSTIYFTLPATP